MKDEERRSRIELSEKLLEVAQHLSEAEMRQSISRIYYASYQAVAVLLDKEFSHQEIANKLKHIDEQLSEDFKALQKVRSTADYTHDWISREFGTLADFRVRFPEIMRSGVAVYRRTRDLIARRDSENG